LTPKIDAKKKDFIIEVQNSTQNSHQQKILPKIPYIFKADNKNSGFNFKKN